MASSSRRYQAPRREDLLSFRQQPHQTLLGLHKLKRSKKNPFTISFKLTISPRWSFLRSCSFKPTISDSSANRTQQGKVSGVMRLKVLNPEKPKAEKGLIDLLIRTSSLYWNSTWSSSAKLSIESTNILWRGNYWDHRCCESRR